MILRLQIMAICFFLLNSSIAQELSFKKTILDIKSKLPIPYTTVHLINTFKSLDADENGHFEIKAKIGDTIEFINKSII